MAMLGACCTSGFSGVYFELVLKPQPAHQERAPSVWAKNGQISAFRLVITLVAAFVKDHAAILTGGFFQGFSLLVLTVITLEAGRGLVVVVVIKYADNILKSFATVVLIVLSTVVSALVFGFCVSSLFVAGCMLVFVVIYLYLRREEEVPAPVPPTNEIPMRQMEREDTQV